MLCGSRNQNATGPRDKVYTTVGLTTARGDPEFKVDYLRSISKVYRDVVKYIVTGTSNLEIISVGNGTLRLDWLPSWAPNWSQQTEISRSLIHSKGFNTAQGMLVNATFESSGKIL
jgi:hypothetical protein